MKNMLVFPNPGGELLFDDLPDAVLPLHSQYDPIAAVITHINSKQSFLQPIGLAEVKFSQSSIRFHQLGELDISDKMYLHNGPFEVIVNNSCAGVVKGFLKDCEFFLRRDSADVYKNNKKCLPLQLKLQLFVPIFAVVVDQ